MEFTIVFFTRVKKKNPLFCNVQIFFLIGPWVYVVNVLLLYVIFVILGHIILPIKMIWNFFLLKWKLLSRVRSCQMCPTLYRRCQMCLTCLMLYSPWNSPGHNTGVGSLSLLLILLLVTKYTNMLWSYWQNLKSRNHKSHQILSCITISYFSLRMIS